MPCMKKLMCSILCLLLLTGCAANVPASNAEPQRSQDVSAQAVTDDDERSTPTEPEAEDEPDSQPEESPAVYMLYQDAPSEKGLLLTDSQLRSRPEDEAILTTCEPIQAGTCVELLSAVQLLPMQFQDWSDGEVWYFVRLLAVRDVPSSTVGFLPASDVTAYTADTAASCTAPLYLKPSAACTVDGVQRVWTDEDPKMPLWLIGDKDENGNYRLSGAAGIEVFVSSLDALEYLQP